MKKILSMAGAIVLAAVLLTGCGIKVKISDYKDDTLAIKDDGEIYELAVVDYSDFAGEGEITAHINGEVSAFNIKSNYKDSKGNAIDAVTVEELSHEGTVYKLVLRYEDEAAYRNMNLVTYERTTVQQAGEEARSMQLIDRETGEKVSWSDVDGELTAILVDPMATERIAVEGKVMYISENAGVESKNEIMVDGLSVIIYK